MKILVLSSTAWSSENSFGISYSNIFEGIPDLEIANVYCQAAAPDNHLVERYYQMTDWSVLRNLISPSVPVGTVFSASREFPDATSPVDVPKKMTSKEEHLYARIRGKRWQLLLWGRDLLWKVGRWRTPELRRFVQEFAPDLIFQPIYYSRSLSDIALYLQECAGVPMVGYVTDDVYTLKQYSLSPLYWLDRVVKRRKVGKVIKRCALLYVISEIQREEYERLLGVPCRILTMGGEFRGSAPEQTRVVGEGVADPVRLVFTGNVGVGRWKSLALIAEAVRELNSSGTKAVLDVYTATPVTRAMDAALTIEGASHLRGAVPSSDIARVQAAADVLVHVEGFSLRDRLQVRQSFSTKIVEYLSRGRCILAVGPKDVASIHYLERNDAAVVAHDPTTVKARVASLVHDGVLRTEYAQKAWATGRRNHDLLEIQQALRADLCRVLMTAGGTR